MPKLTRPLGEVFGTHVRRLRVEAGATREDLARVARERGHHASKTRWQTIESGRYTPTLATMAIAADILGAVRGEPVSLLDLTETEVEIEVGDQLRLSPADLRGVLSGKPVQLASGAGGSSAGAVKDAVDPEFTLRELAQFEGFESPEAAQEALGLTRDQTQAALLLGQRLEQADKRTLQQIDAEAAVVYALMVRLWGRSLTAERNARAGEAYSNKQELASITSTLRRELRAAVEGLTDRQRHPTGIAPSLDVLKAVPEPPKKALRATEGKGDTSAAGPAPEREEEK